MARKLYVLAIYLMAASIGVIGYQVGDYLIDGTWPSVPIQVTWLTFVGPVSGFRQPALERLWHWFGNLPAVAVSMVLAYVFF